MVVEVERVKVLVSKKVSVTMGEGADGADGESEGEGSWAGWEGGCEAVMKGR